MAFAATAFSGSIAGSSRDDEDGTLGSKAPATGALTVKRGTASGNRAPGNQVIVSADAAPAGTHFAGWTGDVAILANPSSSKTTAMVPFTAATVTATFTPVTTSESVPEHVGGGNVLPPTAKPKGYSLTDIAKATAFFVTSGPGDPSDPSSGRSESNEPNVPFQILYDSNINEPHNTFLVRPGTMLYVPIFFSSDSPPITGNFPDVNNPDEVAEYLTSPDELGAIVLEINVDGEVTSLIKTVAGEVTSLGYAVGVNVAPEKLPDGGGTRLVIAAVFLTPLTKGTHTVTIRASFTGAAIPGGFEFEIPYTVTVNK
jgi:hypothetical protein